MTLVNDAQSEGTVNFQRAVDYLGTYTNLKFAFSKDAEKIAKNGNLEFLIFEVAEVNLLVPLEDYQEDYPDKSLDDWFFRYYSYNVYEMELPLWLMKARINPDYFDAAIRLCQILLRTRNCLPREIADWLAASLDPDIKRPRRKPGKHASANARRDLNLVITINELKTKFGLSPTRNKTGSQSACDAILQVLGERRQKYIEYEALEKIWQNQTELRNISDKPSIRPFIPNVSDD